jgi:Fe2+ or Zn2+ uptake regulation protein
MYYNTNRETGVELTDSWIKTAKQNELILRLFMANPNEKLTPDEIHHMCEVCDKDWPITSIRRAINTLTESGNLTKTNELREGKYGKKTHTWKLNTRVRQDINDTNTPGQRDIRL